MKPPLTFDVTDVDLEEAAAESERDRLDHARLARELAALLKHDGVMRVPIAVRRLVDAKVDPVVVAKQLLIGDRAGGPLYELSARAAALAEHEAVAADWIAIALRELDPDVAATMMVTGAVWLAMQFALDRALLAQLVAAAAARPPQVDRRGYGVVDLVDGHGVGDRASIVIAIEHAKLPMFAPLEGAPFRGLS